MSPNKVITLQELRHTLDTLKKIYDHVRIINPLSKKVLDFSDGVLCEISDMCYSIWASGEVCNNCISMRAFNKKDTFLKLEVKNNQVFAVIAMPIQENGNIIILELFKDITNSMDVQVPESARSNTILKTLHEIAQLQVKDGLTGIFNRRFIDERLPADLMSSRIGLVPFTLIVADIDYFKRVNDTYGHAAGDHVLRKFAEMLEKSIHGNTGWAARYGGEEFLVCLKNISTDAVAEFTESLRNLIENSAFDYGGNTIRITSSFGVCTLSKNWNVKAEELFETADKNLYTAKSSGRNKAIFSEI